MSIKNRSKGKRYLIGVDPSVQATNNGVALYDTVKKELLTVRAVSDLSVVGTVLELAQDFGAYNETTKSWENVLVVVENSNLESAVFQAWPSFLSIIKRQIASFKKVGQFNLNLLEKEFRKQMALGTSVGKNQYASIRIIRELTKIHNFEVIEISPNWRDRGDKVKGIGGARVNNLNAFQMPTKLTEAQFRAMTKYKEAVNEHGMDAAMLIYGKNELMLRNFAILKAQQSKSKNVKKRYFKKGKKK